MKKNIFLALAMFAATATQAQVIFSETFDAQQTKTETEVGYYEYINTIEGDEREVADGALHFFNSGEVEGQNWQRAVKFRNLPIEENTSYRVTVKLMGSNEYTSLDGESVKKCAARFALMQGGENLDMGFLASNGEQQFSDISHFQEPSEGKGYYTYTGMFYYTTDAAQKAWYAEQYPAKDELPSTYFLTLNVFNPGDFYIDEVTVEKAAIQSIDYSEEIIRVNFGYALEVKSLLNGNDRVLLPADCAKVKQNGEEVPVLSVEVLSNGKFYIFPDASLQPNDKVEVSFTNPEAQPLQYAEGKTPGGTVISFTDEVATFTENMDDVYSYVFVTPTMIQAVPEDGSFNLPLDTKEFKFTFNKPVDLTLIEARLENEKLTPSVSEGIGTEVTFTRGDSELAAGEYTLTVTKIYPEYMLADDIYGEEKLTYSFGKVNIDPNDTVRVVMTDNFDAAGAGGYPVGWTVIDDNKERSNADAGWGSGSRLIGGFTGGEISTGMYLSGRSGSEGCAIYGSHEAEDEKLHLTPGKYQLIFYACTWDNTADHGVKYEFGDGAENVLFGNSITVTSTGINNNQKVFQSPLTKIEENFRIDTEGDYVLKIWGLDGNGNNGGWGDAIFFGAMQVKYMPAAAGVEETNMLLTALQEAKAVIAQISDERYAGADYDALKAAIEKYDGKETEFTAPSQFKNAAAELNAATAALRNHQSLCDTYDPLVDNAKYARDQRIGTKYEQHKTFADIEAAIAEYEGKVLTDNDSLTVAITTLQNATAAVNNIGRVVDTYIASMVSAIPTLKLVAGEEGAEAAAATEEKVNALLSDDAATKKELQKELAMAIYKRLADPANDLFSEKMDEVTLESYTDSLNLSVFIDNPELYYTSWDDKAPASITSKPDPATESLPGWTISEVERGWDFAYHYPWGSAAQYAYNEVTCPAANGMIASWSTGYRAEQTIEGLPAGTYKLYAGIGERGGNENPTSFIYAQTTEKTDSLIMPVISGSTEPTDNAVISNIVVTDGKLTVGTKMYKTDHAFFNCMHLFMVQPAAGYDYAKGLEELIQAIETVNNSADVVRTEVYDLNGRRVNTAERGLFIIKQTMSDGSVRTQKVIK